MQNSLVLSDKFRGSSASIGLGIAVDRVPAALVIWLIAAGTSVAILEAILWIPSWSESMMSGSEMRLALAFGNRPAEAMPVKLNCGLNY
jgi:hypothetical protein